MGRKLSEDKYQVEAGKMRAELIPASDDIRKIKNTNAQVNNNINPICQFIVVTAPNAVATPLPPLKEKNMGRQ